MNLRPRTGKVLVKLDSVESKTGAGIYLPDGHELIKGEKRNAQKGRVVALGKWPQLKSGLHIIPEVKLGDHVIISDYSGEKLQQGTADRLRLCDLQDVIAIITGPDHNSAR